LFLLCSPGYQEEKTGQPGEIVGNSRRQFLKGIGPAAIAASISSKAKADEIEDKCEYHARCLAEAMKAKYGGTWHHSISHESKAAMIFMKSAGL